MRRIVQWGTGNVGVAAARKVVDHPELELVGCFAHSETKVGQDVGTLIGVDALGFTATNRIDEVIALKPDCVLYMPLVWSVDDMSRLLESGINVISTANFITGRSYGKEAAARLDEAARKGGVSLYGTGINPGQANVVALAATACCATVNKITVREAVDATGYASRETWVSLGFGGPSDAPGLEDKVRDRSLVFHDTVEMMARSLKIDIDEEIGFKADFAVATKDLNLGYMDIDEGTVCGLRMSYSGMVRGVTVIELQLVWRLGYAMTPDWPVEGYVIDIEGAPNVHARFHAEKDETGGGTVTAMNAVHAILSVCDARPGLVLAGELPLIVAASSVVPRAA